MYSVHVHVYNMMNDWATHTVPVKKKLKYLVTGSLVIRSRFAPGSVAVRSGFGRGSVAVRSGFGR